MFTSSYLWDPWVSIVRSWDGWWDARTFPDVSCVNVYCILHYVNGLFLAQIGLPGHRPVLYTQYSRNMISEYLRLANMVLILGQASLPTGKRWESIFPQRWQEKNMETAPNLKRTVLNLYTSSTNTRKLHL